MKRDLKDIYLKMFASLPDRYCRLLLLTGDSSAKNTMINTLICPEIKVIHVGKELSAHLVGISNEKKGARVVDFFTSIDCENSLFLVDIEILFDKTLNINPLKLLKNKARNQAIIVDWPGIIEFTNMTLTYATPEYMDYFQDKITEDILYLDESGRSSITNNLHAGAER